MKLGLLTGVLGDRDRAGAFDVCAELGLDAGAVLGERLAALRGLLDDPRAASRPLDWQADVLGQGELLSSTLGAAYLRAQGLDMGWMDARDWLDAVSLPRVAWIDEPCIMSTSSCSLNARTGGCAGPGISLALRSVTVTNPAAALDRRPVILSSTTRGGSPVRARTVCRPGSQQPRSACSPAPRRRS